MFLRRADDEGGGLAVEEEIADVPPELGVELEFHRPRACAEVGPRVKAGERERPPAGVDDRRGAASQSTPSIPSQLTVGS